jgi:membrane-associated protein
VWSLCLAGYWFGNLPFIKNNLSLVIVAVIAISLLPAGLGYLRHRNGK